MQISLLHIDKEAGEISSGVNFYVITCRISSSVHYSVTDKKNK